MLKREVDMDFPQFSLVRLVSRVHLECFCIFRAVYNSLAETLLVRVS